MGEVVVSIKDKVTQKQPWGDFTVNKTFAVTRNGKRAGVFGCIVQTVTKSTVVTVHDPTGDRVLRTSEAISEFTGGRVQSATQTYSELFPILNGVSADSDNFQNGAILTYKTDPDTGEVYADDEPPTSGTITMVGSIAFVETSEADARDIQSKTDKQSGSVSLLGVTWSFDAATPANGLGYTTEPVSLTRPTQHTVVVTWTGLGKSKGKTAVESRLVAPTGGGRRRTRRRTRRRRL